jgi:hypothetical protein
MEIYLIMDIYFIIGCIGLFASGLWCGDFIKDLIIKEKFNFGLFLITSFFLYVSIAFIITNR